MDGFYDRCDWNIRDDLVGTASFQCTLFSDDYIIVLICDLLTFTVYLLITFHAKIARYYASFLFNVFEVWCILMPGFLQHTHYGFMFIVI